MSNYWCCRADFGEHEPTCPNYKVSKQADHVAPEQAYSVTDSTEKDSESAVNKRCNSPDCSSGVKSDSEQIAADHCDFCYMPERFTPADTYGRHQSKLTLSYFICPFVKLSDAEEPSITMPFKGYMERLEDAVTNGRVTAMRHVKELAERWEKEAEAVISHGNGYKMNEEDRDFYRMMAQHLKMAILADEETSGT